MPWDGSSVMPAIGTGTQADPYIVATPAELSGVMAKIGSDHSTEQYVVLANDIDLAGHQWSPTNLGATNNVISIDGGDIQFITLPFLLMVQRAYRSRFGICFIC